MRFQPALVRQQPPQKLIYYLLMRERLQEFYQVAFHKKLYESIEQLQDDVDDPGYPIRDKRIPKACFEPIGNAVY